VSHPDELLAVLDANVLYPQWLRDVMLTLAAMGYYEPRWSSQIIEEMRRNVLANHPGIDPQRFDDTTISALHVVFATPTEFLLTELEDHTDLMATVLLHLASRRRGVATIADVLDQLARNHALQAFVSRARDQLL
jgi:hypothetical protein